MKNEQKIESQYGKGEKELDRETLELYGVLEEKSRMVSTNMVFFLNETDKLDPVIQKKVMKEIDDDLNALLQKLETPMSRRRKMM